MYLSPQDAKSYKEKLQGKSEQQQTYWSLQGCSRRRRRRKAVHPVNQLPASRQDDVTTQADPAANDNSARWRATRSRSAASERPEMRSTPVKHSHSFTSSPLSQPPIPAANQNAERASHQDHSDILGLYKPASTDPRQDGIPNRGRAAAEVAITL